MYAVNIYTAPRQEIPARVAYFSVNLFAPQESAIQPAETIAIPAAAHTPGKVDGAREIWPWLAAAGWLLLLVEWIAAYAPRRGQGKSLLTQSPPPEVETP